MTFQLLDIPELELYPVDDRGKPNSERIAVLVRETTDMGKYGIMLGHKNSDGSATPFQDNMFWFGPGTVHPGDWLLVYTGKGEAKSVDWEQPETKLHTVHWGKEKTIFANTNLVPILFRMDAVNIGKSPADLPQLGLPNA
jgi:hypothetical protein